MPLAKWRYYARSIPLMLGGFRNWPALIPALLSGRKRVVQIGALQFAYRDAMDLWTIKETCLDDHYRVAGRGIGAGGVVIDIGAGLGDFAILAAHSYPGAIVYAFEPFPESAELCRRNLALNRVANVQLFAHAVGAQNGTLRLDTSAGTAVQHRTIGDQAGAAGLTVTSRSLATIFAEQQLTHCDLLKLDCEGAEFAILLKLDPAILASIQMISLEYHNGVTAHTHQDLIALLERAGFRLEQRSNPVHAHLGMLHAYRS